MSDWLLWLGWLISLVMVPIVVQRKKQPAVCLAWLMLIFVVPYIGLAAYLMIGEVRLGARRVRRYANEIDVAAKADRRETLDHIVQPAIERTQQVILHVADRLGGLPVLGGNSVELMPEYITVVDRLVHDIDGAQHHVHLLFYIYAPDEVGQRVSDALIRARCRGIRCRLLVDDVG